jgi:Co/Zn/Cd efflux system component
VLGALVNAVCLVSMAVYLILAALPALVAAPGATTTFQPTPAFLGVATVGVRGEG